MSDHAISITTTSMPESSTSHGTTPENSLEALQRTKNAALGALDANKTQQVEVIAYIQWLRKAIETANEVITDTERYVLNDDDLVIEGEDKSSKRVYVPGAIRLKPNAGYLTHPDSPFSEDSHQRMRYMAMTTFVPWTHSERNNLRLVIIAEQKRLLAIKLKEQGHQDPLGAVQQHDDSHFAELDTDGLDWDKVASRLAAIPSSGSTKRSASDCRVQWIGNSHPRINNGAWTEAEVMALTTVVWDAINATANDEIIDSASNNDLKAPKIDWSMVSEKLGNSS
ncbi:hypothetical protein FRC03_001153 [Tulasnella sp. 419]|nr:hypothetical protein FRC03_001153 [Tulasnella sp. 419]